MKKYIYLLLISLLLIFTTACSNKDSYTIEASLPNADNDGKKVYLQELKLDGNEVNVDSTTISNSTFKFKGIVEKPCVRFITIAEAEGEIENMSAVILEPGKIKMQIDTITGITGTPMNERYRQLVKQDASIVKRENTLLADYRQQFANEAISTEYSKQLKSRYDAILAEKAKVRFEYLKENMKNPVGEFFFHNYLIVLNPDQVRELITMATPEFQRNERVQTIKAQVEALSSIAEGKPFLDIKGYNLQGQPVTLSEYAGKGKPVILLFWASWSQQSMLHIVSFVNLYEKYKDKIEIVGINLDENPDDWQKALTKYNITWVQISDFDGQISPSGQAYMVVKLPSTVLLNKEGIIVARNLQVSELYPELDHILAN